jgi:hypothetical protein
MALCFSSPESDIIERKLLDVDSRFHFVRANILICKESEGRKTLLMGSELGGYQIILVTL